jgi:opacity protein-like surface antigen
MFVTRNRFRPFVALFLGAASIAPAMADSRPSGFVLGAAGGLSRYEDSCEGVAACDRSDRALRINVGYGLGNGYVVEAVALDFGKLKGSGAGVSAEIQAKALGAGVAHYTALSNNAAFMTRLGLARVKVSGEASGFGVSTASSESKTSLYLSLGLAWSMTPNTAIEAAWEGTKARFGGETQTVSAVTVGLSYRF